MAEKAWPALQREYAQLMDGLEMKISSVTLDGKGTVHRLLAGPVTATRARDICKALNAGKANSCLVAK
jgi:hypothetical protein